MKNTSLAFAAALALVISVFTAQGQNRVPAFEMNKRLGRGINMGNSFEAPTETEWGNPWKPEYFKIISGLGFKHVRLPVRWETAERSSSVAPYTINPTFLKRIQDVVDTALKYKLHIIINMHHHEALFENPVEGKARFLAQWRQIAEHFKDYPDNLLFEVLNEPHGNLTPGLWNEFFALALAEIRKTNPTRVVLLGVAEYGGLGGISKLQLPADEYIILSPHYYNPFPFTHQGAEWVNGAGDWMGTTWMDTEAERESVFSDFSYALRFSEENKIPVHVGEFGAYSKADLPSRIRWTTFLARWFEEQELSWAYWEFSAGFGIYNASTKQVKTALASALLSSEMPEPTAVVATQLYSSNFSSGTDGWFVAYQGGAQGNLTVSSGKANIAVSSAGSETWHLQLIRNNIALVKGKRYRISFSAEAPVERTMNFYVGKATSPWNAYGGGSTVSVTVQPASWSFTFTMSAPDDPAARLVFDLGKNTGSVSIASVKVEQLSFVVTDLIEDERVGKSEAYPNPVSGKLTINGDNKFHSAVLYNSNGIETRRFALGQQVVTVDLSDLPAGVYILWLRGHERNRRLRILKI